MQKLLPFILQLFLLLALGFNSDAADRKERKAEPLPKPPPQPVEQILKVRRGEKLPVSLRIYGTQREALRFLIRKEPASGKLSEPQPRDRESALVTYVPPEDLSVTRDQFSYAVQSSAGVSAAVDVVIAIVDDPPVLAIPDSVNFSSILTGQSSSQEIEIANRGGGMAAGELKVDAPWRIEGSTEYKLAAGEARKVTLVFAPILAGPFRGELHFSSDRTRTVGLRGEAQAALSAVPATVMLQTLPGDLIRTGVFELVNGTEEPQTVTFAENPRLQFRKNVELPPNGRTAVTVQAADGSVAAIAEEILAKGAGVELRIAVTGQMVGPVLRALGDQVSFGAVTPASGASGTIEVQNVGGAEGYWRWESVAPFSPIEEGFKLAPGERKVLTVRLGSGASAHYRAMLKLVGEGQTVEVLAEVMTTPSVVARRSVPHSKASAKHVSVRTDSATETKKRERREEEEEISEVAPLLSRIQTLEPTNAVVLWQLRGHQGGFRLEIRSLGLDSGGNLKVTWAPAPSAQVRTEGKRVVTEINGLTPNTVYGFRLMNVSPGSTVGEEVGMVQFKTPGKQPTVKFNRLQALVLVLVVLLGIIAWRKLKRL